MDKENFTIHSGEHICLIRTLCNRSDFCEILNKIKNSLDFTQKDRKTVAFLMYNGSEYPIERMLEKNLKIKNFATNSNYVQNVSRNEFFVSKQRRFVFEVIVDESCDVSDMHYLILLLKYLEFIRENYNVLISAARTKTKRYSALRTSDYFKISYLLYFFGNAQNETNFHSNIFHRIKAYCNKSIESKGTNDTVNKVEDIRWRSLALNYEKQPQAGRLVPIIPITSKSFEALITDYNSINKNDKNFWQARIYELCNDYINRILKINSSVFSKEVIDLLDSDNCLEALIFLSTLYYILVEDKEGFYKITSLLSISNIHESCTDYSQGIAQLAENIVNHVIGESDNAGYGIFSIRFRTKSDAKRIYLNSEEEFCDVNYFMEINITDFQFDNFEGIVEKFYGNVKKRILNSYNSSEEFLINSKFYFSQVEDPEMMEKLDGKIDANVINRMKSYINSLKKRSNVKVTLSDLFLNNSNIALADYLSSSENVAFHYGLQILNSVISVADGFLYVKSGEGPLNTYSNNYNNIKYLDIPEFKYDFGTLYVIHIPLRLKQNISYLDSIAVSNNVIEQKNDYIVFESEKQITYSNKEFESRTLYQSIDDYFNIHASLENECQIGILDCQKTFDTALCSRTYVYEIIAKALFLYLVNEKSKIDNIALINVESKYDVIKIFRQFALFFDRNGCNRLIKKSKSVFIVDKNGQTDILFCGNTIKSISKSLCLSQLYGGTDEKAMEIIRCLVRDENE